MCFSYALQPRWNTISGECNFICVMSITITDVSQRLSLQEATKGDGGGGGAVTRRALFPFPDYEWSSNQSCWLLNDPAAQWPCRLPVPYCERMDVSWTADTRVPAELNCASSLLHLALTATVERPNYLCDPTGRSAQAPAAWTQGEHEENLHEVGVLIIIYEHPIFLFPPR